MLFNFFHKKTYPGLHKTEFIPYAHSRYKTYSRFPQIALPAPSALSRDRLLDVIDERRSCRSFDAHAHISLSELSRILWAASEHDETEGKNEFDEPMIRRRYPSPGALYPLELYIAANRVKNLDAGIYHYHVQKHGLELVRDAQMLAEMNDALTYDFSKDAACHILFTAIWHRSSIKYGEFAYRATLLETGHLAHTMLLIGEGLDIGCLPLAGFNHEKIETMLDLRGLNENFLYGLALGVKKHE